MKVIVIGTQTYGEEATKLAEIAKLLDVENDMIVVVGEKDFNNRESLIEKIAELEKPLLFKPLPRIEDVQLIKQRRTNHERQPSRYRRK